LVVDVGEVGVEEVVGERDHSFIGLLPPVALIAADQEDCRAAWVKREHDPHRPDAQLFHVLVPGAGDRVHQRPPEPRPALLEHPHGGVDALLLIDAQRVPPGSEVVRELDVPHSNTIPSTAYVVKGIYLSMDA
jgi:hypothetical protein